jgi:hypothetical protein
MTTLAHTRNDVAATDFARTRAERFTVISDVRAIAYAFAMIGAITVGTFTLLSSAHFAPTVAKDLRHQSELLSQAGDQAGAVAASRKAVDIYRGLLRVSMMQYEPKLAAGLHELSARLSGAGDGAGALVAIHEAVDLRRHLARYSTRDAASFRQSLALLSQIETNEASRIKTAENTVR